MSKKSISLIPKNENYNEALTWSKASSFSFGDLEGVSEEHVNQLLSAVGGLWSMNEIDFSMVEKFVYDGFDYRALQKSLVLIAIQNKYNTDRMKDLISKALAIHQLCGNITEKRFKALGGVGKEMVNEVLKDLKIKMNKKSGLSRGDITLPRLGALFPFALSVVANRFPRDYASKYNTTQLMSFMKTSSFPSLVPVGQKYTKLLIDAYTCYSVDMTVAITGKDYSNLKSEELVSIQEKQRRFVSLSHNSGVLTHETRVRAMRALRVESLSSYNSLKLVAESYGVVDVPSAAMWESYFIESYATVKKDGVPLKPLGGVAFEETAAPPMMQASMSASTVTPHSQAQISQPTAISSGVFFDSSGLVKPPISAKPAATKQSSTRIPSSKGKAPIRSSQTQPTASTSQLEVPPLAPVYSPLVSASTTSAIPAQQAWGEGVESEEGEPKSDEAGGAEYFD